MGAQLATVVAVRRTSTGTGGLPTCSTTPCELRGRIRPTQEGTDLLAFATPSNALGAVDRLVAAEPSLAIGIHVAELDEDPSRNHDVAELVTSLARRAEAGDVLVTDVVAQLAGGSTRTFSGRGHVQVAGLLTRVHALARHRPASSGPTFGRMVELASLDWMVDELLAGSGRSVILEGEAGIGKSHLAAEALERTAAAGILGARAAGDQLGHDRPGRLAVDLIADLERQSTDGPGTRPTVDGGDHRFVDQFTACVEAFAEERPVLLVAEDIHWADDLSLRAIGALAPRLAPISAAVLATLRPVPRLGVVSKLLDVLEDAGAEHHLLHPLDPEAVTSLVATLTGAPPGPRLRDRLLTTAGSPLFVIEMLDALGHDHALDIDDGVVEIGMNAVDLPDRLRDTALRRVHDLPDTTVSVLRHACLLGSTCQLEDLSTVTGHAAADVIAELLPAVQAGVLSRSDDTVEFRHEVIREAVIADLAPAVRREMHGTAGNALAQAGAPSIQVARQLALGAKPGDIEPVEWLERAAGEARPFDPAATVELLTEARALAPDGWAGTDRLESSMIEPLTASGRVDEAIWSARSLLSTGLPPDLRDRVTDTLVAALATRGHLLQAAEVAAAASARTDADPHRRLLLDCIATGMRIFVDGSTDDARRAAQTALASRDDPTGTPGGDEIVCWARNSLGLAALADGRYEDAFAEFDRSRRALDRVGISDRGFLIPHFNALTAVAYLDDFESFETQRQAVLDQATSRGDPAILVIGHFGGAVVAFATGRWDDAVAEVEAGLSLASETGVGSMTVGLHALGALVAAGRARPDEADGHLARGFEVLERGAHLFGVDLLVLGRARRLEELGATHEAGELLAGLWGQTGHIALALQHRDLLPHVVRLGGSVLGGQLEGVLDAADRAARRTPVPSTIAAAARCRGLARQDADLLVTAVEHLRQSPRIEELAQTCEETAAACFAVGRDDEAARLVDEAVTIWDGAGATNHIARLDALARAHGVRRRRSRPAGATHGWVALSPKELEVADLVAEGLSNPVIGERLYISRRTVESHLSHVFTKLGLSNRAQLAAAVVERRNKPTDP